jgi:RimJ/RimL family protein N-acetyltransferase
VASARAQKAAGYREVGRWHLDRFVDGEWLDHILTEVMRDDWAKGQAKAKARRKQS